MCLTATGNNIASSAVSLYAGPQSDMPAKSDLLP